VAAPAKVQTTRRHRQLMAVAAQLRARFFFAVAIMVILLNY
jgi:hypothetical protein